MKMLELVFVSILLFCISLPWAIISYIASSGLMWIFNIQLSIGELGKFGIIWTLMASLVIAVNYIQDRKQIGKLNFFSWIGLTD